MACEESLEELLKTLEDEFFPPTISTYFVYDNSIEESENTVANVVNTAQRNGLFYFSEGAIDYKEGDKKWECGTKDKEEEHQPRAYVNLIDKIKVYTISQFTVNVSRQFAMCGIEGTEDQSTRRCTGAPEVFLQEVFKCNNPHGTVARYKRIDTSSVPHGHGVLEDFNVNRINVNMPRGYNNFVLLMRAAIAHYNFVNPDALVTAVLDPASENNNSVTADSVINGVINSFSFKYHAVQSDTKFNLTPKTTFGTHKVVELYDDGEGPSTYHRLKSFYYLSSEEEKEWLQTLKPLYGIELQVHEHSMNCSAVPGSKLLPVICRKGAQLLDEENGDKIQVSLALSNAKGMMEKIAHSLIWTPLVSFCDLMCWRLGTPVMSYKDEHYVFKTLCEPIISKFMVCRDNYAQATDFCQQMICSTKMYTDPQLHVISHKFKVPEIEAFFTPSKPRFPEYIDFYKQIQHPSELHNSAKSLITNLSRNESIVKLYEMGPAVFRSRFDLNPPFIHNL